MHIVWLGIIFVNGAQQREIFFVDWFVISLVIYISYYLY